jgi:hypothetical protein
MTPSGPSSAAAAAAAVGGLKFDADMQQYGISQVRQLLLLCVTLITWALVVSYQILRL